MKIRLRYVLPAMLMLAGCATMSDGGNNAGNEAAPAMAPPQRVSAVSDVLGAKMDAMVASRPSSSSDAMR